jgi:hypothetical protein
VRAILLLIMAVFCFTDRARAQQPLDVGTPEAAFAGSPMRLSKNAVGALRAHYQGDKVPLVPQPFRTRLDTAFLGRDWPRVEAAKKDLATTHGMVTALAWEQTRFIATGSIGIAEMHALDVAGTGSTGLSETAVMLWFYAVAVTMTDGHKCADPAAKDAHLDRLRGPVFEPVNRIIRAIADDRLGAMRDLAIRLETVLAVDRTDDTMCRNTAGQADIKPDPVWRPEAALTRSMLPRHLAALGTVMRPRPVTRPEPPKADSMKPVVARNRATEPAVAEPPKPRTAKIDPAKTEPAKIEPGRVDPEPAKSGPSTPTPASPDTAETEPAQPEPAPRPPEPVQSGAMTRPAYPPDPARFEPPQLELPAPASSAGH